MKVLVVSAHPLGKSLCQLLSGQVVRQLREMGHEVTVLDLYNKRFDPLLSQEERASYYAEHYDSHRVDDQAKQLQQAQGLVLLFPTWWFGMPAILKGWFDRVWGPGIAYDHASDLGPIKPRLEQLQKVMIITTLGSPWWVDRFVMWRPVYRVLKTALIGTCAPKAKVEYLALYRAEKVEERRQIRFSYRIQQRLYRWRDST